jgi:hypothetical protein
VPLIQVRGRYTFRNGFVLGGEAAGFWAGNRFLNGSSREFEGSILDLSLRAGLKVYRQAEVFVNLRYLAGGALGGDSKTGTAPGYTRNWLHVMILSLGIGYY